MGRTGGTHLERLNVARLESPILIVAPHPDDDVLGTGGLIQVAQHSGKAIYILYITAGDANSGSVKHYLRKPLLPKWYRRLGYVRHQEAIKAESYLGVPRSHLFFLGFPDAVTLRIVTDPVYNRVHTSPLTQLSNAAYTFAYKKRAPYSHESLLTLVESVMKKVKPKTVFVTLRQDTNPDHKAAHIIVNEAIGRLRIHPTMYSFLIHYPHFPNRIGPIVPPKRLNAPNPVTLPLTPRETARKRIAFSFMRSQASRSYRKFFRQNELFWRSKSV